MIFQLFFNKFYKQTEGEKMTYKRKTFLAVSFLSIALLLGVFTQTTPGESNIIMSVLTLLLVITSTGVLFLPEKEPEKEVGHKVNLN